MYFIRFFFTVCVITLALQSNFSLGAEGSGLTELKSVSDAKAIGWKPMAKTKLTITSESKIGRSALMIRPEKNSGDYMGIDFKSNLDLTGAGATDKISFYVKQNFGRGMRIIIWTDSGVLNRSFSLNYNGWTHVNLDMDLKNWETPKSVKKWGKISRILLCAKSFNSPKQYMIIDGLTLTAKGKRVTCSQPLRLKTWKFPQVTKKAWIIGNADASWAISKETGEVIGGWNVKTKEYYLLSLVGRYHLEDRKSLITGLGSKDKVLKSKFIPKSQSVELICSNRKVPDLKITKQYWIRDNKLFQKVGFTTKSNDLQFITYNTQASFKKSYRDAGFYMGGADGGGPLIPAPNIDAWQKVTEHQNTPKGMLLSQPDKGYSFAQIRTRLDDKFVWPWFTGAIATYCERKNIMHYTPDGWDMSLGTSKLSKTKETSYEQYISIFKGDWQQFLKVEYASLPEVQEALKEIPPVPAWVGNVKMSAGQNVDRLRQIIEMTDDGEIMSIVCFTGSWADYYVDEGMSGGLGGWINAKELKSLVQRIKALSPRMKVGIYMWQLSTTVNTRIYKKHPEWFRTTNKDGEICSTFPGLRANFAQLLSIPEAYAELLHQYEIVLNYLGTDFIFLDDPKAINPVDWKSGEYTRDDLAFKFFLDLKRLVAKHGSDKAILFNNRGNPYADINYIEARGALRADYWRQFSGIAFVIQEFISSMRPDARIIPLYYAPPQEREYVNHLLAMGWIPSLLYGNAIERRAFVQAAYEIGNCKTVSLRYSPDAKNDKKTNIESYAVQRKNDTGYILSLTSHEKKRKTIPVELELDSFKLNTNGQIFVWEYYIEDASTFKGIATEPLIRDLYEKTGWQIDHVARRKLIYAGPYKKNLKLNINMEPLALNQLYVTDQPAGIYSENSFPGNYIFAQKPKVKLSCKTNWEKGSITTQIDSSRNKAEIITFLPLGEYQIKSVSLDGKPVNPILVWENNNVFPIVKVDKGQHKLQIVFNRAATTKKILAVKQPKVSKSAKNLRVSLPGYDKAIFTIENNGRLLFNREVSSKTGEFVIPLASARKQAGKYDVSVKGVVDANGKVQLTTTKPVLVDLPADPPNLGLTPIKPKWFTGEREIVDVNRKIKGLDVLRSAIRTTSTLRGYSQPNLKALVAVTQPDKLQIEAGTTRKMDITVTGATYAGLEIKNLRKVKVKLSNTFHSAFHILGPGNHLPHSKSTVNFAGIVVDYHTSKGYTKRARLAVGVMDPKCNSVSPDYGKRGLADITLDLGLGVISTPEKIFSIDLQKYAPKGWDGQVWLSVGTDHIAFDRRLTLQILAANDDVSDKFISVTDPKAYKEAYDKPKTLLVPRSPGGILIDGTADEEWWKEGVKTKQFFLHGGKGVSDADTFAQLLYDEKNLYIAFTCMEPSRAKPFISGGALWNDDEVEVWIDANGDGKTYKQIIINAANEKMELSEAGQKNKVGVKSSAFVTKGAWMVEMAIPFKGLGIKPPKRGDKMRISLCRFRPAGAGFNDQMIVWAPLKHEGFSPKDLPNFGTLIFK